MKNLVLLLLILCGGIASKAQLTTVFTDDFERTLVSPGGTPVMTYISTLGSGDAATLASVNGTSMLKLGSGSSGAGKVVSWVTGPLSSYAAQFNPILSANLGMISWSFNLQANNNPNTGTGFNTTGSYAIGVILCTSNSNPATLLTSGTGYAITGTTSGTGDLDLVKFTNGLGGTLTPIISTTGANGLSNYRSVRVTYDPATGSWLFYHRSDGSSGPVDPNTGTVPLVGSATDNTYTGTVMSQFGYIWSHNNSTNKVGQYDNYKVTINIPPPAVLVNTLGFTGNFGNVVMGSNSAEQHYSLSAANLTDIVKIKAPANFKVSTTSGSGFLDSLSINPVNGTVASTTIYVRYQPQAATGATGTLNITNASLGAPTQSIPVSGNALAIEPTTTGTIDFQMITDTTVTIDLLSVGNGTRRMIAMNLGSPPAFTPTDGIAVSGVNSNYTLAADQGNGNRIIYDGSGSGAAVVTVTHLTPNMLYYVVVYEYNVGTGSSHNYLLNPAPYNNVTTVLDISTNGINNTAIARSIKLYPNPARDVLYVNAPLTVNVVLKDMQGRVVLVQENAGTIDISNLVDGVYIATITSGSGRVLKNEKIIKSR